jgi:glycogen synthase
MERYDVFYAAGPGDVIGTFRCWLEGRDDQREISQTFSGQFMDVCRDAGLRALIVAHRNPQAAHSDGKVRVEHRPPVDLGKGGLGYHLSMLLSGLRIDWLTWRSRAKVAVVSSGMAHWWTLLPLVLTGVKVVPTYHNRALSPLGQSRLSARALRRLDRVLLRQASAILVPSHGVGRQVASIIDGATPPLLDYLPVYQPDEFADFKAQDPRARPFRVLYIGRIEEAKGVLLLLEAARRIHGSGLDVEFDLCGDGTILSSVRQRAQALGLAEVFHLHGHCERPALRSHLAAAHVLVAPTSQTLGEGLPMVVAEATLALRPAIISDACQIEYFVGATEVIKSDDADVLTTTITNMVGNPERYAELARGCEGVRNQFLDPSRGFAAALRSALGHAAVIHG